MMTINPKGEEIAQLSHSVTPGRRDKFKVEGSFEVLASVMDEPSKRVLPLHTRAAVVSRVCVSKRKCRYGIIVEGRSGEVGTFEFVVEWTDTRWLLCSVTRCAPPFGLAVVQSAFTSLHIISAHQYDVSCLLSPMHIHFPNSSFP